MKRSMGRPILMVEAVSTYRDYERGVSNGNAMRLPPIMIGDVRLDLGSNNVWI